MVVLLIQEGLWRCRQFWQAAHSALLRSAQRNQRLEDRHHTPAPTYALSQKVWVTPKDFPLLASRYKMINPVVVWLKILPFICHLLSLCPPAHWGKNLFSPFLCSSKENTFSSIPAHFILSKQNTPYKSSPGKPIQWFFFQKRALLMTNEWKYWTRMKNEDYYYLKDLFIFFVLKFLYECYIT